MSAPSSQTNPAPAVDARPTGPRAFGRFKLIKLLGKSDSTMSWLASDPRAGHEVMLCMPRAQLSDDFSMEVWQRDARKATRLSHPHLAPVIETGVHERWPYMTVDRATGLTLPEWLNQHPAYTVLESVDWLCQLLEALSFAHEAGVTHGDLQAHHVLISDQGAVRVMGFACCGDGVAREITSWHERRGTESAMPFDPSSLRAQRAGAERDVLAGGLVLHLLLSGENPLGEADLGRVIASMPPSGRQVLRLPWSTPLPISESLRAIANRAVASQERQRYLSGRTFLRALQGWMEVEGRDNGGPLALLLDRLKTVGHLPALPGLGKRVAALNAMEGQHTDTIAEHILQDMALSFELLRQVNSVHVSAGHLMGGAPVLTVRRAVALLGLNGVHRCSNALRVWPGPLNPSAAAAMEITIDRVRLAGLVAQLLRPAGFDAEMVYLVSALQNLGRLLVQYHFADEAEQIRQLMRPGPAEPDSPPGAPESPGMSEAIASLAVLGADIESLGAAVAKYWGLGEEVQHMMRRLPVNRPIRNADNDADMLRAVASAANEVVDVITYLPQSRMAQALAQVVQRYNRLLKLDISTLTQALQHARSLLRAGPAVERTAPVAKPIEPRLAEAGASVSTGDKKAQVDPAVSVVTKQPTASGHHE